MSKVAFLSFPFYGHVNPSLEMVAELVRRGEEVVYYSGESFKEQIEATGAHFRSYGDTGGIFFNGTGSGEVKLNALERFADLVTGTLEASKRVIRNIIEDVKQEKPDYVIRDCYALWGGTIAKAIGVPAVSCSASMLVNDKIIDCETGFFMENVLRMLDDPSIMKNRSELRGILSAMAKIIAGAYGMKKFNILDAFNGFEALNIVYTSRYFQPFSETFDDSFLFIGPSMNLKARDTELPFDIKEDGPLIYIALGTVFNACTDFYKKCFEAFGGACYRVVMSVGGKVDITGLGDIPDNFIVRSFVPQVAVLKRADVFITHGGMNSVCESLTFNVPMAVFPQQADQFMVAHLIEKLGAGMYIRDKGISPGRIREMVEELCRDKSYRDNGSRIRESFKASGGVGQAVDAIFKYKEQYC